MTTNGIEEKFTGGSRINRVAISLASLGLIAIAGSMLAGKIDAHRFWANIQMNNIFFIAIALAGTFFVAAHRIANAGWHVAIKRIPEAMGSFIPVAGVLLVLTYFLGGHDLYHWLHDGLTDKNSPEYDQLIDGKSAFLNNGFFIARMVVYVGGWTLFTYLLRRLSLREDIEGGIKSFRRRNTISAIFLVFFAVTSSTFAWDWIMSTDPHWYSTLFGWYTFSSFWVSGLAVITLMVVYLKKQGYLKAVTEEHLHDLGKFMFAFSIFWTYLWFSQYMLIWYANIPEETAYYIERLGDYKILFFLNPFLNFLCPFLILMSREAKRDMNTLVVASCVILAGHWVDFFLMIMPNVVGEHWHIGFLEIGCTMVYAGAFIWMMFRSLSRAPLVSKNHPYLEESLHYHT